MYPVIYQDFYIWGTAGFLPTTLCPTQRWVGALFLGPTSGICSSPCGVLSAYVVASLNPDFSIDSADSLQGQQNKQDWWSFILGFELSRIRFCQFKRGSCMLRYYDLYHNTCSIVPFCFLITIVTIDIYRSLIATSRDWDITRSTINKNSRDQNNCFITENPFPNSHHTTPTSESRKIIWVSTQK